MIKLGSGYILPEEPSQQKARLREMGLICQNRGAGMALTDQQKNDGATILRPQRASAKKWGCNWVNVKDAQKYSHYPNHF